MSPLTTPSRTVIITGASSGIGRALALRLAESGHRLVLAARGEEALRSAALECEQYGAEVLAVVADMAVASDVKRLAAQAVERFGSFDVWVNNASLIYYATFDDIPEDEFRKVIDVNLFGYTYGCQEALRQFKNQGHGTLINVASGYGVFPAPYVAPYVASKYAVRGLTAVLRQEIRAAGNHDIHICTVLPATIDTPIYQEAANRTGKQVVALQPVYPVEVAVKTIADLLTNPRDEVTAGGAARAVMTVYQLWPWAGERLMGWYARRFGYKDVDEAPSTGNIFASLSQGQADGGWPTWQRHAAKAAVVGVGLIGILWYMRRRLGKSVKGDE